MEDGMDESSSGEWESSTDSSSSSSSEDSSLGGSDSSSSSSEESAVPSTKLEDCKVNGALLKLPQGLCEQEDVFQQLLSYETWQNLSATNKEHLKKFLPTFQSNNDTEQETTLQLLLNGENVRFGNPLKDFHRNLKNGYYRPDIARMRRLLRKALNREYNYSQKRYYFRVMKSVLVSRQKLLQAANVLPPGMNPKVPRLPAPPRTQQLSTRDFRTRRRYFQELRAVRQEVGESGHSSEDENYPEGPPAQMNKKLKRRLSVLETSICPEMRRVVSTLASKPAGLDLAANVTASNNPYELSDEAYRNMLIRHKKRRLTGDTHPELNCTGRSLHDVVDRANRVMSKKGLPISLKFEALGKPIPKQIQKRRNSKMQPETTVPSPSPLTMADSSDMVESDDDDIISVTRLLENIDKAQRAQLEKKALEKEKDNDIKDVVRGREWEEKEREKDKEKERVPNKEKERDEWDKFIENDVEKFPASTTPRSAGTKPNKKSITSRTGKPNNLSGLPTSRRILKGELEDAVDSLLNSGSNASMSSPSDSKPPKMQSQYQQSLPMSSHNQKLQEQLKEEDVGVKVVQATSFPAAQDTSLLPDLSNIDMMSLPIDIEDPEPEVNVEDLPATPSLMQETHSCFFALLRDLICSAKEQSMSLSNLQAGLRRWQESPISPLNDWYPQAANSGGWVSSLTSALTFLSGQLPDMHPDEFVPYLEYKPSIRKYQWIGAGRDSDNLLMPLCTYWLERCDEAAEMQSKANKTNLKKDSVVETENNIYVDDEEMGVYLPVDPTNDYADRLDSPPPSCNPTDWVVRPTTLEEKQQFRAQELERFANPLRAFTYKMHGYESVVGPLRGVFSTASLNVKPRGHSLLVSDRPNYVTILALVRDAVARLPNGQGTRMDICELLKDSQYLKPGATEQTVQSVVSGALDRLHYEPDPCVKYEPKRKIWICLHRNRTMEEYEQMHQFQGLGKAKYRKSGGRVKKEKDLKAETKAAVATVTSSINNTVRQVPQVEAEVTNMPTGLHTIQVTTRPAASLTSGSLWNTPMELPLLPSTPSPVSSGTASVSSLSTTSTTPSQSARTILSARLPTSPAIGRKSMKKQAVSIDGVESIVPLSGTNVRSVLGSPSTDVAKTTPQQIVMGGRLIASTAGRKSLVMTSSGGVPQMVQLATQAKQSLTGSNASSQATLLLTGSPTTVSSNIQAVCSTTSSSPAQWTTIATSPSTVQRQTALLPQSQQMTPRKPTEIKRPAIKSNDTSAKPLHPLPGGVTQTISLDANTQRQLKQQQLLMIKQRQQQQAQQQVQQQAQQQAAQQQAAQQQAAQQQAAQQQAAQQQAAQQQAAQQQAAQQQAAQQQAAQQQAAQQQAAQQLHQHQIQQHQQQLQLQLQEQQLQQQQQQQQQLQQQQQQQLQQQQQQQQIQQQQQQQQLQLQQQFQAQQLQQVQPQLQAIQPQGHELDQHIQTLELDRKQQEQLQQQLQQQKQQLQIQQKVALSTSQKQLQQQTLQLIQQQLKDKSGALSLSNIQLVDQSGTVMAVQTSESQNTVGRPRQNLVLVRQAGNDQGAQLTAMLQKQQQLLLLKQKQQSMKDLSEAQQQQLQLRQKQVQDMLKQQLKAQQVAKVQTAGAQTQIQQQLVVVSGSAQQQVKQQLAAQQKQAQAQTQLVVLKQPRGQAGQLVNTVGGILPQQMFVVKTKAGAGQKQVLTQLTAEQQAGLLALQRQQQQQVQQVQQQHIQIQQQQQQQPQQQQQTIVQQSQLQQQPPPLQLQHQPATTGVTQLQLSDQSQQQRQQIQQVLQSQGKNVRGTSILGQGILTTAALTSSTVTTASAKQGPPPMVAKVVTNSQGQQLITMEAFQAQNKGTLRVAPAAGKAQPNQLIQLAGSGAGGVPQFAVVSQGNIISLASSINTQRIVPQALTLSASATTTTAVTASKLSTGTINATVAQSPGNLRMVGGAGLNIAHIGGKPVLLASKQQGLQGQNVILTSPAGGQQTVLLASQPLRPASSAANQQTATAATSNAVVLQQAGGTQQILLPAGFQGGTINLKGIQGIQGLQGLKVIPVAQAATPDGTKGRSQMFARIISPSTVRAAGVQQSTIAVAVAGTTGTTTVAAATAPGVTPISSNKEPTNI